MRCVRLVIACAQGGVRIRRGHNRNGLWQRHGRRRRIFRGGKLLRARSRAEQGVAGYRQAYEECGFWLHASMLYSY